MDTSAASARNIGNASAGRKGNGIIGRIRETAIELLRENADGLRHSELVRLISARDPTLNARTIAAALHDLDRIMSRDVYKPARGHYRHLDCRDNAAEQGTEAVSSAQKVREEEFYGPFANWLKDEAEEATKAIPLGGNVFRDKWGTPDVIGCREPRRSDVIQRATTIVSAEIKLDTSQLMAAFGQACAYCLFSHTAYVVVPRQCSAEDLERLDALCERHGIGLVSFDATSVTNPSFARLVRPRKQEPDLFFTNRYVLQIERQLFS